MGKHGVPFQEATQVFYDPGMIELYDEDHSIYEDRFFAIGFSSRRLLTVVFTQPTDDVIRIISAWVSMPLEVRTYEEENR